MLEFEYITEVLEVAEILTKIYNLLLTMFYFAIAWCGYKVIRGCLRKGALYGRFN